MLADSFILPDFCTNIVIVIIITIENPKLNLVQCIILGDERVLPIVIISLTSQLTWKSDNELAGSYFLPSLKNIGFNR